ncbi:MAG: hypothetical protein J6N19_00590 [Clostridium sp.]|nr:hypothetical protein [Clostridium sp.]
MAWISVDQKLIGGKLRRLHKTIGCSRHEAIGILVTLWLWGLDNADTDGFINNAETADIAEVLKPGICDDLDPETTAEALVETGWIDRLDGRLYFHDWPEWRKYYNRFIKESQSHAERTRRYRERKRAAESESVTSDVTADVTSDDTEPEKKPKKQTQAEKYGQDFEVFWQIYPRHDDKAEAFEKFKARVRDGFPPEQLIDAARNYAARCQRERTEPKYIKQGKTFLSTKLPFTDYLKKPEQGYGSPYTAGKQDPYQGQYQRLDPERNPFQ